MTRPLTSMLEWHVRGFADGSLDSEVEVSRKWFIHFVARPGSYYTPLMRILRQSRIQFGTYGTIPPDASYIYLPEFFGRRIAVEVPTTR